MSAPELGGAPSRFSSSDLKETPESRISRIEGKIDSFATKEDIQKLKVWILGGMAVIGGAVLLSIFTAFARVFFSQTQIFTPQSNPSSATAYSSSPVPSVPSEQQYQAGVGCDDQQTP